jgi:hypothetical protein
MQIELKKYFIIIRSATVKLHQWEREEEPWLHQENCQHLRAANPLFVSEEFEHTALVQCPPSGAPILAAYLPFVWHVWPILHLNF